MRTAGKYYVLSILLAIFYFGISGYARQIRFTVLTIDDGLSQSVVSQIYKDRQGYVWIATQDGLNRYNGYKFEVFRNNVYDSTSISDNNITAIAETNDGLLWIGTSNGGLNVFNPFTRKFSVVSIDEKQELLNIKALLTDSKGDLWVIAENYIYQYRRQSGIWQRISFNLPGKAIFTCLYFKDDILWIGTKNYGILSYNPVSKQINNYLEYDNAGNPKFSFTVNDIYLDDAGILWYATTGKGLCKIDLKSMQYEYLLYENIIANFVRDISEGNLPGELWIASTKGLLVLNRQTTERYTANGKHGLLSNTVNCIFNAKNGNIWVGTDRGINIYKKYLFKFEHIYKPENGKKPEYAPSGNTIMCFEQLNDSIMVIGNLEHGLDFWNIKTNRFTNYPTYINKLHYRILALLHDTANHKLWIGAWGGGFNYYDTRTQTFSQAVDTKHPLNHTRLAGNTVLDFEKGPGNTLWIATYNGLSVLDITRQTITNYFTIDGLPDKLVNTLTYDSVRNRMWIGTGKEMCYFDFSDNKIHPFHLKNKKLIHTKSVNTILVDNEVLWIGTSQGLIKYNFTTGEEKGFFTQHGLLNDYIYGILKDSENHLWISTNKGLARFDIRKETFKHFTEEDGLQSNEFNQGAYFKAIDSTMYFGGINGFNRFVPEKITDNPIAPKIYITQILLRNEPFQSDTSLLFKNTISIAYKQAKSITLEFEALEYTLPQENMYQWKLEGFDDEWSEPTHRNFALYNNLEGGEYVFKVRAANHDGIWSKQPATLRIIIIPPFYKTVPFYIFCVIGGIIIVLLIIRFRTQKIKAENKKLEEKVQERTKELNEKNKDILSSIEYAKRIQEAILPPQEKIAKAFPQSFILYLPKDIVSGDFYWFAETENNYFMAAVDCTGHGVPGAFMSMIGHSLLNQIVQIQHVENTAEILNRLNERVVNALNQQGHKYDTRDGMDLALIRCPKNSTTIEYSGAFRPLYVVRQNGLFEKINADKRPIGGSIDNEFSFRAHLIQLNAGDTVYMFSDGYPDQFGGPKNKKFMVKNFQKMLMKIHHLPPVEQKNEIIRIFNEWKGLNEQVDDILVIGIRF